MTMIIAKGAREAPEESSLLEQPAVETQEGAPWIGICVFHHHHILFTNIITSFSSSSPSYHFHHHPRWSLGLPEVPPQPRPNHNRFNENINFSKQWDFTLVLCSDADGWLVGQTNQICPHQNLPQAPTRNCLLYHQKHSFSEKMGKFLNKYASYVEPAG